MLLPKVEPELDSVLRHDLSISHLPINNIFLQYPDIGAVLSRICSTTLNSSMTTLLEVVPASYDQFVSILLNLVDQYPLFLVHYIVSFSILLTQSALRTLK
jgi:hypothetical protein